jgi:hypothetical protein
MVPRENSRAGMTDLDKCSQGGGRPLWGCSYTKAFSHRGKAFIPVWCDKIGPQGLKSVVM